MKSLPCLVASLAAVVALSPATAAVAPLSGGGIKGRVVFTGKPVGNPLIRMGVDPGCSAANAGKRRVQELLVTGQDGGVANVFVTLVGKFPSSAVPATPVTPVNIDQIGCLYVPRVVGARVGQKLRVRNSDPFLHNVHSLSKGDNPFNVGQPTAGMATEFVLKPEPGMLRVACDVHRWMTAYVGVVDHPYFAVSSAQGSFEIQGIPAGSYSVRAWHERLGELTQPVRVTGSGTSAVTFTFKDTPPPQSR